ELATSLFREFREQPTPELARSARIGVARAISPNERLQLIYGPWVSYFVVPLFALANAGVVIDGASLVQAFTSPVGLGGLIGLSLGKPLGALLFTQVLHRMSRGRLTPPVGWAGVLGGGTAAGVGFTVSLLIARIALGGQSVGGSGVDGDRLRD